MNERMTATIRPLQESDYEKFLFLISQFRETTFSYTMFCEQLQMIRKWGTIWVLFEEDEMVATATMYLEPKFIFNCVKLAHVEDVCVDSRFRRKGYGKQLMHFLYETAVKEGAYKITLDCNNVNIDFYRMCGYEIRGNQMSQLCTKAI